MEKKRQKMVLRGIQAGKSERKEDTRFREREQSEQPKRGRLGKHPEPNPNKRGRETDRLVNVERGVPPNWTSRDFEKKAITTHKHDPAKWGALDDGTKRSGLSHSRYPPDGPSEGRRRSVVRSPQLHKGGG